MAAAWTPTLGQVALLEFADAADMIGVVIGNDGGPVTVSLGSSRLPFTEADVLASFFTPEALYRVHGKALGREGDEGVVDLEVHEVERVQRRGAPRARVTLPVTLADVGSGEPALTVHGETIDIGPGGCRVRTTMPFPLASDPTVSLHLAEGDTIVLPAAVLQMETVMGAWEYRLVFMSVDEGARRRLLALATAPPPAG
ncbi:MAG: PilZ domain-containing protein [Actinomycetota bacterium]|nr:PilZ domain-containing protein [Actinomycetota bacterium]